MELPKFLMCDNSSFPDDLYVLHTEYPRFLVNVTTEDEDDSVEFLDDIEDTEDAEVDVNEVEALIEAAYTFYDTEMDKYEEEED